MDTIQSLRAAVFGHPDPADSPHLDALLAAEASAPVLAKHSSSSTNILWQSTTAPVEPSSRGPAMGSHTTGLTVTARLRMAHVPTSIVQLLDATKHPLISVRIHNGRHHTARVRVTSFVDGYSARSVDTVEIPPGKHDELHLLPAFFPERLATVTEVCRAALRIQIDDLDGKTEQERTFPIWLLARTSALLHVPDPSTGMPSDLMSYLGAWVTPNAPAIFEVLRSSADSLPDGSIASYQVDVDGVAAQVKAFYGALQSVGITYVNSVLCFGPIPGVLAQRIRLPSESLAHRSANCIDGTVLLASILEAASLRPAIVVVPGHAFLAWATTEDSSDWDYLETTVLSSKPFDSAVEQGRKLAQKYQQLADNHPGVFVRLPVHELRAQGVWPME